MYEIGDLVWYRDRWGAGKPVAGVIVGRGEKNGRLVYDVSTHTGCDHWGYETQFERRFASIMERV